jgi:hypothetical protein
MPTRLSWGDCKAGRSFFKTVLDSEEQWIVVFIQNKKTQEGKEATTHSLSLAAELRSFAQVSFAPCMS